MMVALIEDQIHKYFIDQEEERCRKPEDKLRNDAKKKTKKVKRRDVPKPWRRNATRGLCQETELLLLVNEYDYDLSDEGFQKYCKERGVLHVAGTPGSTRWRVFLDHGKTKDEYIKDPYFQFAQESIGVRHKYAERDMEIGWEIIRIGRAKLQDCWELYRRPLRD